MIHPKQQSLFEAEFADSLGRDAVMERGLLLAITETQWVRIDRRGVVLLDKVIRDHGIATTERRVAALSMLPMQAFTLRDEVYIQVLYATRHGATALDTVRLQAILQPERHQCIVQSLAARGFTLDTEQWQGLAGALRLVLRAQRARGDLVDEHLSPTDWCDKGGFLVPRERPQFKVIRGGAHATA